MLSIQIDTLKAYIWLFILYSTISNCPSLQNIWNGVFHFVYLIDAVCTVIIYFREFSRLHFHIFLPRVEYFQRTFKLLSLMSQCLIVSKGLFREKKSVVLSLYIQILCLHKTCTKWMSAEVVDCKSVMSKEWVLGSSAMPFTSLQQQRMLQDQRGRMVIQFYSKCSLLGLGKVEQQ